MPSPYLPVRWLIDTPDKADDPDIFPLLPGQMFIAGKAPTWATTVKTTKSGRELRNGEWSAPRWRFRVAYEVLRDKPPTLNELRRLFGFFNARKGRLGEFFYWEPGDHEVTDQFLGFGGGGNRTFQLIRSLPDFDEPVYAVYGDPVIKVAGVVQDPNDYVLNDFGVLVFDSAPASGASVTWSGEFMYWCRFDQDDLTAQQMVERMWSQDGLSFISLKP